MASHTLHVPTRRVIVDAGCPVSEIDVEEACRFHSNRQYNLPYRYIHWHYRRKLRRARHQHVPYVETMPAYVATNPYGWTKIMIEQILRDHTAANPDFSAVLLRYFNPIGAHESGLLGEDPNGIPNNLMPYIARVAAGKLEQLTVFGDDYPTPDGTGLRDYLHVVDLAKGHLKALEYAQTHTGTEAFNLGTGRAVSVLELVHTFERVNGVKVNHVIGPRRAGDLAKCWADTAKAKEVLVWTAEKSVEDMCRDSWNFVKNQH